MRTRPLVALVVTATAAALATSALAAPTAVTVETVSRAGTTVTAAGTAVFDGVVQAASVGGTNTDPPVAPVGGHAGVQLVDALIAPLEDGKGLRFIWQLDSLPAQVPPEGTRYTWSFGIGDKTFQLQAKRTNMGSTTVLDDAAGHAAALSKNGFFQLRGNCTDSYMGTPVASCPHIAFLTGAFDVANKQVTMDVPFGLEVAPAIAPGAVITEVQTAGMSITAAFQAGVSNANTSDVINGWNPYYAGPNVSLASGVATSNPATLQYVPATLDGQSWSGTVAAPTTRTTLFVRTCEGASSSCTYTSAPIG
ncbi:MAG TPA: hypothetical protein VM433_04835 [Mycobacteriales bacterium]|nr:hypothetical protein [Mycobacteriales bacterium]